MNILLLMDPFIPVPPIYYGGIERVMYDIACKYKEMGHEVTIIAGPNSKSPGRLITYGQNGELNPALDLKVLAEVARILCKELKKHDVIHNFGRLVFLVPFAWFKIRKVQTYMRYIDRRNIQRFDSLRMRNLAYTAVSDVIVATGKTTKSNWHTVYNCAPVNYFTFRPSVPDNAYLVFLGRIERCKGLHSAIKVAKLSSKNLVIAGNISTLPHEISYFEQEIKPLIDGNQIRYIGVVNNEQKNVLLGSAAALLTPIEWVEPFPIIIPEAFACGTPVLGFNMGGVPEGISHGSTGFISETVEQMAGHVLRIHELSRAACRKEAETKFSDTVIANRYLDIYKAISHKGTKTQSSTKI
ncbi:glycosyltransferase [Parasediminibacterium sp. JCM 36343]|uniref:glycosyltransferase n=1 Tax=Parasediminibacterium sp. JCM 36343 TaxID=3374279 RepID=UPI00397B6B0C